MLLGDKFEVQNFGVSGATIIKHGTRPYDQQGACSDAIKFRPQWAVIMLGTNDTNKQTWPDYQQDFVADYSSLIDELRKASPGVQIFICLPPPLFRDRGKERDTDAILNEQVMPKIKSLAQKLDVGLIDLNSIFADRSALLPDGGPSKFRRGRTDGPNGKREIATATGIKIIPRVACHDSRRSLPRLAVSGSFQRTVSSRSSPCARRGRG